MFLSADLGHRLPHMLHDVEAFVDERMRRIGHVLDHGLDVRFPPVHDHGPDAFELLRRELLGIALKALVTGRRQLGGHARRPVGKCPMSTISPAS